MNNALRNMKDACLSPKGQVIIVLVVFLFTSATVVFYTGTRLNEIAKMIPCSIQYYAQKISDDETRHERFTDNDPRDLRYRNRFQSRMMTAFLLCQVSGEYQSERFPEMRMKDIPKYTEWLMLIRLSALVSSLITLVALIVINRQKYFVQ